MTYNAKQVDMLLKQMAQSAKRVENLRKKLESNLAAKLVKNAA